MGNFDRNQRNQQGRRPFQYMFNERTGFGSFARTEGFGLVMLCGPFGSQIEGMWPIKVLEGWHAGNVENLPESDLQKLDPSKNDLPRCRELVGQPAPERQQGNQQRQGGGFGGNRPQQGNQGDRPRNPYLFFGEKPYGATVKVEQKGGGLFLRISRTDENGSTSGLPMPVLRQVDSRVKNATDRDGRQLPGKYYSYVEYELDFDGEVPQQPEVAEASTTEAEGYVFSDDERES